MTTMLPRDEWLQARATAAERRWPMAVAVLVAIALTASVPESLRILPRGLVPAVEGVLLIALVAGDPGKIDRRGRWIRALSIGLVVVLMVTAFWAVALLIDRLIAGGAITNSATELLRAGGSVWLTSNIAFSLLYWELDGGGPAE